MFRIEEYQVKDFANDQVINRIDIIENEKGTFHLFLKLSWKEEECALINARKSLRSWSNLNTLLNYLKNLNINNLSQIPISLKLHQK